MTYVFGSNEIDSIDRERIGRVAVDSGQLMISDPCYIGPKWNVDEEYDPAEPDENGSYPMSYNGCCGATNSEDGYGQIDNLSLAFASGLGDGVYDVYGTFLNTKDWGRRIAKIEIEMIRIDDELDDDDEVIDTMWDDVKILSSLNR